MPMVREHSLETTFVRQTSMRSVFSTPQFANPCRAVTLLSNGGLLNMTKGQFVPSCLSYGESPEVVLGRRSNGPRGGQSV